MKVLIRNEPQKGVSVHLHGDSGGCEVQNLWQYADNTPFADYFRNMYISFNYGSIEGLTREQALQIKEWVEAMGDILNLPPETRIVNGLPKMGTPWPKGIGWIELEARLRTKKWHQELVAAMQDKLILDRIFGGLGFYDELVPRDRIIKIVKDDPDPKKNAFYIR